jgi:cell division protein FtsQ
MSRSNSIKPMQTTIKRSKKRPAIKVKSRHKPSRIAAFFSKTFALIPVRTETVESVMSACTVLLIVGAVGAVAIFAGVPNFVGTQMAQAAGRAGFQLERVEVKGVDRMESLTVYTIATRDKSLAMPLVDLERIRNELMQYSWIADARVSRRLPDTLVVDIVERKPAAIWQHNQKLSLVDEEGVVLEAVDPKSMPNLPLVIGEHANQQVAGLDDLLSEVPALKPALTGATWIGNRRWDLRFGSGEVLALPEGPDIAAKALQHFARVDGTKRLLGRGFVHFDMRDPSRMVVRLNRDITPASKRDEKDTSKVKKSDVEQM